MRICTCLLLNKARSNIFTNPKLLNLLLISDGLIRILRLLLPSDHTPSKIACVIRNCCSIDKKYRFTELRAIPLIGGVHLIIKWVILTTDHNHSLIMLVNQIHMRCLFLLLRSIYQRVWTLIIIIPVLH